MDRTNGNSYGTNLNLGRKNGCLDGANRNLGRTNGNLNLDRANECGVPNHETHPFFVSFAFFVAVRNMKRFLNCDFRIIKTSP